MNLLLRIIPVNFFIAKYTIFPRHPMKEFFQGPNPILRINDFVSGESPREPLP